MELWYCWTLTRAVQAQHWPIKASWKSWPAIMQETTCSCTISPQRGAVSRTVRGSVLTEGQPRAQWQRDIRWLSCSTIVIREFTRVMTSLSFKSLSVICPTPRLCSLCSLKSWRQQLFSVNALLHQTRRSVGSWSHTHKTNKPLQRSFRSFWGTISWSLHPFFFNILQFQRQGRELQCNSFTPSGQIWQVCPFYLRSPRAPGAPLIRSHRQMTCERSWAL